MLWVRGGVVLHKVDRKGISKHFSQLLSHFLCPNYTPFPCFILIIFFSSVNSLMCNMDKALFSNFPIMIALK